MSQFLKKWSTRISRSAVTSPLKLPETKYFDEHDKKHELIRLYRNKHHRKAYLTEIDFAQIDVDNDQQLSIDVF